MILCDGDSEEVEELLTQRRPSQLHALRFLGENVLLQLVHHVTHREAKKSLRSSTNHHRTMKRPRRDSVGVVEDAEGDGVGNVGEESIEIGRVDDGSLVAMFDSILQSLIEHAEEELELAGDASRRRTRVREDQRAQLLQTPQQRHLCVEKAIRNVVLQAHEGRSSDEVPSSTPLIERRIINIIEAEVVQSHLFEAILRRHQRLHFLRLARPRALSLLLPRIDDTQKRLLLSVENGVGEDSFLQLDHVFDVVALARSFQQLFSTESFILTFPAKTTGVRGASMSESGNESNEDTRDCGDSSSNESTGHKFPIPCDPIGTGKKGRQRGSG